MPKYTPTAPWSHNWRRVLDEACAIPQNIWIANSRNGELSMMMVTRCGISPASAAFSWREREMLIMCPNACSRHGFSVEWGEVCVLIRFCNEPKIMLLCCFVFFLGKKKAVEWWPTWMEWLWISRAWDMFREDSRSSTSNGTTSSWSSRWSIASFAPFAMLCIVFTSLNTMLGASWKNHGNKTAISPQITITIIQMIIFLQSLDTTIQYKHKHAHTRREKQWQSSHMRD